MTFRRFGPVALSIVLPASSAGQAPRAPVWETLAVGATASFRGLSVVDDRVIWASGTRGTVVHTVDGGATWTVDTIPGAAAMDLRSIYAVDGLVAHVAATAGRIWRTTDGGQTWSMRYRSADSAVFLDALAFADARFGMALGDPIGGRFLILVTVDGGDTWRESPPSSRPKAVEGEAAFAASGTSLVTCDGYFWLGTGGAAANVFRSADRGLSWTGGAAGIPGRPGSGGIFSVAFVDSGAGIVVGGDYQRPDSATRVAAVTADGGRHWEPVLEGPRGYRSGVSLHRQGDALLAVAVGTTGSDVSRDGGRTWSPLDGTAFNAVQFAPSGIAFAVGARGRIARLDSRRLGTSGR